MKCLQCNKPATVAANLNGYQIRECADGHRTVQLTAAQETEIISKMEVSTDNQGNSVLMVAKKSKKKTAAIRRAA